MEDTQSPTTNSVVASETKPETQTGTVINSTGTEELSSGATAGISAAIGVGNVCCGPVCYTCPTVLSSIIGIVLYFSWKKDIPKTAKTILIVTIVTALIAFGGFGILFAIGLAGSILDSASY